jgi:hypothetical protein
MIINAKGFRSEVLSYYELKKSAVQDVEEINSILEKAGLKMLDTHRDKYERLKGMKDYSMKKFDLKNIDFER